MKLPALRARRRPVPADDEPRRTSPLWERLRRRPPGHELRAVLTRNWGPKLVSLLLAFFIWYSITKTERDAERLIDLPVSLIKLPVSYTVTNPPTKPVTLTVRGPRTILDNVDERKSRVRVNLSTAQLGDNRVELNENMITTELPRSLKVVRFDPPYVTLRVEKLVMRRLPVKPALVGNPSLGYTVAQSTVAPDVVEVTGPAGVVGELKQVTTEPIDLNGVAEPLTRSVLIEHPDPSVTFVPDVVRVSVTLAEAMMMREFRQAPIVVQGAQNADVSPDTVDLKVRGPERLLSDFTLQEGAVTVEAAGLGPGTHSADVHVALPEGLVVAEQSVDKVRVKIPPAGGAH
jgi:YbbR domain-containing protein